MGTRAQFFIGNPEDIDTREWLGCVAYDGYPTGDLAPLAEAKSETDFRDTLARLTGVRRDFCDPAEHGFRFPWIDDLFLTDCTYAWFSGKVMMTRFHNGWIEMRDYLHQGDAVLEIYGRRNDLSDSVPAPTGTWDRSGPDSIMIISSR